MNMVYLGRERTMGKNRTEADIVSESKNTTKYEIEVSRN